MVPDSATVDRPSKDIYFSLFFFKYVKKIKSGPNTFPVPPFVFHTLTCYKSFTKLLTELFYSCLLKTYPDASVFLQRLCLVYVLSIVECKQ